MLASIRIDENETENVTEATVTYLPRKNTHKNMHVLKFMKMQLYFGQEKGVDVKASTRLASPQTIAHDLPPTLILTSLRRNDRIDDSSLDETRQEDRELFMANLLNEFQMRGIKLREKYPKIYRNLCLYVDEHRPFTPCCLFPRDLTSNNLFMCLIMPDSEPTNYAWLYENEMHASVNYFNPVETRETADASQSELNENKLDDTVLTNNIRNTSFNLSQYLWIR